MCMCMTQCQRSDLGHTAQVVSLHCNLSEETYHLLNEDRLNMMKKDATLINCARGPVIDEVALTNFLQANENFRCGNLLSATCLEHLS